MNIVILSRGPKLYSTRSLVRAGEERGHDMRIIDHTMCHLIIEKDRLGIHYKGDDLGKIDAVVPRIGSSVTSQGASVIQHFELMKIPTTTRSYALLQCRDKLKCLQKLTSCGIDVPKTIFMGKGGDIESTINHVGGLPVIIKVTESTHGAGVILAESYKSATNVIDTFHYLKERVLVQEFIEETKGSDVRVLVVGGEVVSAMKRTARAGEFRSNLHQGATAEPVKLSAREKALAIKATQIMGLDVAGVDLLISNRGPLVLEINASPGLEGIETITGVDVATHIIQFIERKNVITQNADRG